MKLCELFGNTFKALRPVAKAKVAEMARRQLILYPDGPLVERHLSCNSAFCRAAVACGYLSQEQMQRAAIRYRLGMSRDGGVIFWQIDQLGQVFDGKIMYYRSDCHRDHSHNPTWVSSVLKTFYQPPVDIMSEHCLFGLHLLRTFKTPSNSPCLGGEHRGVAPLPKQGKATGESGGAVAIVESEKTAVIMSERFPKYLWLATGGLNELTPIKLFPLRGRKIILFPDTDSDGTAFRLWYEQAKKAEKLLGQPVTVSALLERHATAQQKAAKIDLVEWLPCGGAGLPTEKKPTF